jgi:hypothetical protein
MDYDGRYEGGNDAFFMVVRVDVGGSGVISADVFRGTEYLTSTRTRSGLVVESAAGTWPAEFSASQATTASGTVPGTITVTPSVDLPGALTACVRPDLDVAGLPGGTDVVVTLGRQGAEVRQLGVEIETEQGVGAPEPFAFAGTSVDVHECLRRAGFALTAVGAPTLIPRQDQPWDYSRMFTLLHDLMTAAARTNLSAAAWQMQLLMLSATTRAGLHGVMFDLAGLLPRQGCAVFLDEIRRHAAHQGQSPDRNAIRTIVHEIGHGLNLVHRFEQQVGRADSTSFMNYPAKYVPGGPDGYWPNFRFSFDADELEFLRHAPLGSVRPGDAAFHSLPYWSGHGWLPPTPLPPASVLHLSLIAPPVGTTFTVGQPVFLEVVLQNVGDVPVSFAAEPLDLKIGPLRVFFRPKPTGEGEPGEFRPFVPLVMGCVQPPDLVTLPAHDLLSNNLNIGFGGNGTTFREAGTYQVAALLDLDEPWGRVYAQVLEIRVVEEPDADTATLLRPDVGAWFALGGSDGLEAAGEVLDELCARRRARKGAADPLVAAIVRASGINAGRQVTRFQHGQFRERASDPVRAEALLGSLDAAALRNFDPHTAAGTARLAGHYAAMNRGQRP